MCAESSNLHLLDDEGALEGCRCRELLPGAQNADGQGLSALASVSSLSPAGLGWTSARASQTMTATGPSTGGARSEAHRRRVLLSQRPEAMGGAGLQVSLGSPSPEPGNGAKVPGGTEHRARLSRGWGVGDRGRDTFLNRQPAHIEPAPHLRYTTQYCLGCSQTRVTITSRLQHLLTPKRISPPCSTPHSPTSPQGTFHVKGITARDVCMYPYSLCGHYSTSIQAAPTFWL